ncbi:Pyrimidine monooxygenase [Venturia inaequalis]|nr:Pyrimidine monooxygenase [Venturia inaequalis]
MSQHLNMAEFTGTHILVSGEGDNEYIRETAWFWTQRGQQIFVARGGLRGAPLMVVNAQPLQIRFLHHPQGDGFAGTSPANAFTTAPAPVPAPASVSPCPVLLQLLDEHPVSRIRDDGTRSEPGRRRPRWWVEYNDEMKAVAKEEHRWKHRAGKKVRTRRDRKTVNDFNLKKKEEEKK